MTEEDKPLTDEEIKKIIDEEAEDVLSVKDGHIIYVWKDKEGQFGRKGNCYLAIDDHVTGFNGKPIRMRRRKRR